MGHFEGNVISRAAAEALHRYQYHGSDKSLLYKYILSPLAEGLMVFIPMWMAPNLVTVIGLLFTTASYVLMYYTAPGMRTEDTPSWVFPIAAFGLFIYQTLDNMDGKQARRTKSSSPLGLIFDHGCDAINCAFGIVFAACIINAGASLPLLAAVFLNQVVPFFTTTWEHYHTDRMILPIVNGPSEGVLLGIGAACLRGYYGIEFFDEPREVLRGATYGMALIGFSLSGVLLTVLIQLVSVWKRRMETGRSMAVPLWDCSGFALLLGASGFWARSSPELFMEIPYTMVTLLCVLHVDICVHMMVCHVSDIRSRPIRPLLLPFLLVMGNSVIPSGPLVKETYIIWGLTAVCFIYESMYLSTVVREVSMALGIHAFRLGTANAGSSKTS